MMNVHNIMEEIVSQRVNNLYEQIKKQNSSWLTCDCANCRLDTISYVLNRVPPKYVVSGRGVTYTASVLEDNQLKADIDAVGMDGMRIVSSTKRPFHTEARKECEIQSEKGPVFNFPTFIGTVLDGSTFEPLTGAIITLKKDGKEVDMIDKTWSNPCSTYQSTKGAYTFWAMPEKAENFGISKSFIFTIEISAPDYEDTVYTFEVPVVSEKEARSELNSTFSLKIKDLVLFRNDISNPMD